MSDKRRQGILDGNWSGSKKVEVECGSPGLHTSKQVEVENGSTGDLYH